MLNLGGACLYVVPEIYSTTVTFMKHVAEHHFMVTIYHFICIEVSRFYT